MAVIRVNLFGQFKATHDGTLITRYRSNKVQALLAFLIAEHADSHTREALMTLLWPDIGQKSAQVNLRQTLYRLRRLLPNVVFSEKRRLQLNPQAIDQGFSADTFTGDELFSGSGTAIYFIDGSNFIVNYPPDGDDNIKVTVYDIETQQPSTDYPINIEFALPPIDAVEGCSEISFDPDVTLKVSNASPYQALGALNFREGKNGDLITTVRLHRTNVCQLEFNADGSLLASMDIEGNLHIWDVASTIETGDVILTASFQLFDEQDMGNLSLTFGSTKDKLQITSGKSWKLYDLGNPRLNSPLIPK